MILLGRALDQNTKNCDFDQRFLLTSLFGTPPLAGENPTYGDTEGLYTFRENMSSSRIPAVKVPRTAVLALHGPLRAYLSYRIRYFRGFQALKKRLTSSRFFSTVFPTAKVSIRIKARVTRVFIFFNPRIVCFSNPNILSIRLFTRSTALRLL